MLYGFWAFKFSKAPPLRKRRDGRKTMAARLKATQNGIRWIGSVIKAVGPHPCKISCHQGNKWIPIRTAVSDVPPVRQMHEPWGETKKGQFCSSWTLGGHPVYLCNCTLTDFIVHNMFFSTLKCNGMTHFVHSVERGLSVTAILITLPHVQRHAKMVND